MKTKFYIIILYLIFLISCGTTTQIKQESVSQEKKFLKENKSEKKLYKGEGLVIAITVPKSRNLSNEKDWIPLYMQDSLTGNFAHYTKMTVLDRSNENLIKAEQELSETGFYSEENSIQIGHMTNASMVVVGSIQQIGDLYEINFRINDITTNEIKSSTNERYTYSDIESGNAITTIVQNLLDGLKIQLSEKEKTELSKVNKSENNSMQNLAKGLTAEKSKDYITAIAAYSLVDGKAKTEAQSNIHNLLAGSFDSASIQSRVAYYKEQIEKWNTIFVQLTKYMNDNGSFIIYDFSKVTDKIKLELNLVDFTVEPGVSCIPNRIAMQVCSDVMIEWRKLSYNKDNEIWMKSVKLPNLKTTEYLSGNHVSESLQMSYYCPVILINGDGDIIGRDKAGGFCYATIYSDPPLETYLKSQKKYYSDGQFWKFEFKNVRLKDIKGEITIKMLPDETKKDMIFSIDEWNEYINNTEVK